MGDGPDGQDLATVEKNFAANLRYYREQIGLSQEDLAQRMTERGFGFTQATVWKIEQGKRAVRIGEAVALVNALGAPSWMDLTRPPHAFRYAAELQVLNGRASAAFAAIKTATAEFLGAQLEIAATAHVARNAGVDVPDVWTSWLQEPAERAVLEARVAWTRKDELAEQLDGTVDTIMTSLRANGYNPTIDPDDFETVGGSSS